MRIVRPVDEEMWWEVARKCAYATFFHTPLWHKLATQAYSGQKDVTVGIVFDSGVRAVLPLLETRKLGGLRRDVFSSFAGCYGDLIADGPVNIEERESVFQHVFSPMMASMQIADNPIHCQPRPMGNLVEKEDFTHILSLDSAFDIIFSNFSKGHRSSFRKGQRMHVAVRLAVTLDDYYAYYETYRDSLKRWGDQATSRYPRILFEKGFHNAQQYPEHMKLWLATVDAKVVAGAWVFYWNQHADWWHGAALADYFDHYPNNVLQTHIIKDAIENGYRFYDLNPSGGHENVARFKKRFGAQKWPLSRWEYQNRGMRWARKMKSALGYGN